MIQTQEFTRINKKPETRRQPPIFVDVRGRRDGSGQLMDKIRLMSLRRLDLINGTKPWLSQCPAPNTESNAQNRATVMERGPCQRATTPARVQNFRD